MQKHFKLKAGTNELNKPTIAQFSREIFEDKENVGKQWK